MDAWGEILVSYVVAASLMCLGALIVAEAPPSLVSGAADPHQITPTLTAQITPTLSVTPTQTLEPTPTLGAEWGVDRICLCHVPPLDPGSLECEDLKARYVATIEAAWGTQTRIAKGTDTPSPVPSDTATATETSVPTLTPSITPSQTIEPTPTQAPPTATRTVVPTPSVTERAWLPILLVRRRRS